MTTTWPSSAARSPASRDRGVNAILVAGPAYPRTPRRDHTAGFTSTRASRRAAREASRPRLRFEQCERVGMDWTTEHDEGTSVSHRLLQRFGSRARIALSSRPWHHGAAAYEPIVSTAHPFRIRPQLQRSWRLPDARRSHRRVAARVSKRGAPQDERARHY